MRTGVSLVVGLLTLVVLGVVWGTVVLNLPRQEKSPAPQPSSGLSTLPAPPSPPVVESPAPAPEVSIAEIPKVEPAPISASVELKCQAEVEQLCPEGGPGGDRRRCLQNKGRHLSAVCQRVAQDRMVRVKEEAQRMRAACEADVRRFCRNVPPGPGRILQCLEEHAQDVSEQCYRTLPRRGVLN